MLKAVEQPVHWLAASSRCHSAGVSGADWLLRFEGESAESGEAAAIATVSFTVYRDSEAR